VDQGDRSEGLSANHIGRNVEADSGDVHRGGAPEPSTPR